MDIKLDKPKRLPIHFKIGSVLCVLLVSGVFYAKSYMQQASNFVDQSDLMLAKVEQGQFSIDVKGLGSLALEKRHLITSFSGGKVVELFVKPGEFVTQNQPIARLENPTLKQQLAQKKNLLLKLKAQHQGELAEYKARINEAKVGYFEAELAHKANEMQWQAQSTLIAQGNSTISKLDHQKSEFSVKRSQKQLTLQQSNVQTQKEILLAKQNAHIAEQESVQSEIAILQQNVTQLVIKAPISGQIQDLFIELGMRLTSASSVAEIADHKRLIAKINVPELDAPNISYGQNAIIDTYSSQLNAKVIRVSPKVTNAHVEVELSIIDPLPNEARDKLNVEAVINTSFKPDALFVSMPTDAVANNINSVFVLEGHIATKQQVRFGARSVNHIEVLAGLAPEQQIIVSDMAKYINDQQVLVR